MSEPPRCAAPRSRGRGPRRGTARGEAAPCGRRGEEGHAKWFPTWSDNAKALTSVPALVAQLLLASLLCAVAAAAAEPEVVPPQPHCPVPLEYPASARSS